MILNNIRLEDFISHKKTELELGYGINVVVGPNGAGKTSILDGISFALFSDSSSRGKKENLINSRAKKCKVGLAFTEGGIGYDVEWVMERKGAAQGSLFRLANGKKSLLVRGGERSVVPEIEKVLGIDKNMFLQSVYVRQGEIEKLVTARPGDRKELISRLLGVEDLERAWNGMKTIIQAYINKQIALETELKRKPTIKKQKNEAEAKSKELQEKLALKKNNMACANSELSGLQAVLDELKEKKKKFNAVDKERSTIEQNITNLEKKLEREQDELKRALAAEEIVRSLEDYANKLPFLEDYVRGLAEKESQQLKRDAFQGKLDEIAQLSKSLEENVNGHEVYIEKEEQIAEKQKQRRKFEGADTALNKAKKQLETFEKEKIKKNADLTKELDRCLKALGEPLYVDNVQAVLEAVRNESQAKIKEIDSRIDEINGSLRVLEQRKIDLDENLGKFASDSGVKACPTCETELSPNRVLQLTSKYSLERNAAETRLTNLHADFKEAKRTRDQALERKTQIDSVDPERVRCLAAELAEATDHVARMKLEIEEVTKQAETLQTLDAELAKLENEKNAFEEASNEYDLAKRRLDKMPSEEDVAAEMKPVTATLTEISGLLRTSVEKLGVEPKEPQKELKILRKKKEEYDQNLPIAHRKIEFESNVTLATEELLACKENCSKIIREIEALGYDGNEHERTEKEVELKSQAIQDVKEDIARTDQALKGFEEEVRKYVEELKVLEEKTTEKKLVDGYVVTLNKIRDAYGKDGIQKMIRARARPLLEKTTRDLFERFNLAYSDIKIDDDYNISVIGPSGEQDIDQISGGERVALAIALRLAIAQVLSGRIETVIMDEPTTHLDEERRKELVNILNSFFRVGGRIIPQMLIITHHNEIEEVADVVYSVKKKEGYSTVESGRSLDTVS